MTENYIFNRLFNGGRYSLPWLLHFTTSNGDLFFVNALEDISFDGNIYKASTFAYTEPNNQGSGGSLKITLVDNTLIEELDTSDTLKLKVTGLISEDGTVEPVHVYTHMSAEASWNSNMELQLTLNADDRMTMTFPPYVFDSDNNRGGN